MTSNSAGSAEPRGRPARVLRAIAYYKFAKTAVFTAVGLGALRLINPRVAALLDAWSAALAASHERRIVVEFAAWVSGLTPRRLETFAFGAFFFAALFLVEGAGLWLGKRWAEYLTVIATTLFLPLEIIRVVQHVTPTRSATLLLNLVVVLLLADYLRRHPAHQRAAPTAS